MAASYKWYINRAVSGVLK